MNEDRLVAIETKLAYQEKTLKDLNDVVCEQQEEIDALNAKYDKLVKRCREYERVLSGIDAPAPHY